MLNMSTLSTNDQGKSFWELVYGSVNQVPADHCRWRQLWRSPFPVTLQRIFNSSLKKLSHVVFCCNFWTLHQNRMIISVVAAKIWYLKNVRFLLGHPVDSTEQYNIIIYSVSQKKSPLRGPGISHFSHKRLRIFNRFLHTYYTFLSTLDYKFLFNYLQLWRSYAILSSTTQFT